MTLWRASFAGEAPAGFAWMPPEAARAGMPSVMLRLLALLDREAWRGETGASNRRSTR